MKLLADSVYLHYNSPVATGQKTEWLYEIIQEAVDL